MEYAESCHEADDPKLVKILQQYGEFLILYSDREDNPDPKQSNNYDNKTNSSYNYLDVIVPDESSNRCKSLETVFITRLNKDEDLRNDFRKFNKSKNANEGLRSKYRATPNKVVNIKRSKSMDFRKPKANHVQEDFRKQDEFISHVDYVSIF